MCRDHEIFSLYRSWIRKYSQVWSTALTLLTNSTLFSTNQQTLHFDRTISFVSFRKLNDGFSKSYLNSVAGFPVLWKTMSCQFNQTNHNKTRSGSVRPFKLKFEGKTPWNYNNHTSKFIPFENFVLVTGCLYRCPPVIVKYQTRNTR